MAVIKRGRRFGVRVWDPRAQRQWWVGTRASRKDAEALEREALDRVERGFHTGDELVSHFAERWADDFGSHRQRSTNVHNSQMVRPFVRDFGERTLRSISKMEVRAWVFGGKAPPAIRHITELWHGARKRNGNVIVVAHTSNVPAVRMMFTDAVSDGLADANPFTGLRLKGSPGRKHRSPFLVDSLDEALRRLDLLIADVCDPDRKWDQEWAQSVFAPMILVAAYTGVRPGELFALQWQDVDLRDGRVHVRRQYKSKTGETGLPKNLQERTVVLPAPAVEALKQVPREPDGPIFRIPRGSRFTQRALHYYWDKVRPAPGMDFYELRHFCGTWFAAKGASDRVIAYQLGHTDGGALARRLYIHTLKDDALAELDAASAR